MSIEPYYEQKRFWAEHTFFCVKVGKKIVEIWDPKKYFKNIKAYVYGKEKIVADVIVCRAFKKLEEILNISREKIQKPHKLIILKGKNAQSEINNVSLGSNYSYKIEKSITDHDSKIIIVDVK